LKEALKPELFVKAAIVIMGAGVGIKALAWITTETLRLTKCRVLGR
jgi:hypothetical protein